MKDVLLKILCTRITAYKEEPVNHHSHPEFVNIIIDGFEDASSEIADIEKAFVEWCIENTTSDKLRFPQVYKADSKYMAFVNGGGIMFKSIDELFNFWYNKIREQN